MIVIENMPERPVPAIVAPTPAVAAVVVPDSADERIARLMLESSIPQGERVAAAPARTRGRATVANIASKGSPAAAAAIGAPGGSLTVAIPTRIPAQCVHDNAREYHLNPLILLAILKVESNGRSVIARNTNGTEDIGPAQFNTNSWFKVLTQKYKIPPQALMTDMCQVLRALSFALRTEINGAGGDFWRGVGNYHSRTPVHHYKYIRLVHGAYSKMASKGAF